MAGGQALDLADVANKGGRPVLRVLREPREPRTHKRPSLCTGGSSVLSAASHPALTN